MEGASITDIPALIQHRPLPFRQSASWGITPIELTNMEIRLRHQAMLPLRPKATHCQALINSDEDDTITVLHPSKTFENAGLELVRGDRSWHELA